MKKIVIIGGGGFGREVLEIFKAENHENPKWEILGFIDDDIAKDSLINGYPVLGDIAWFETHNYNIGCVIAIADPSVKKRIVDRLEKRETIFYNAIHPTVISSEFVEYGNGVIICAGCILTVNIVIHDHVILNINSTVGHDTVINKYCSIMPGAIINGNNTIGEGCYIGTGATFIHERTIGSWSIIGAGAVVAKNIENNVLAIGIPARVVKAV